MACKIKENHIREGSVQGRGSLSFVKVCENTGYNRNERDCEFAKGALSVLAGMFSLRYLSFENCGISDTDMNWFRGTLKLSGLVLAGNPGCTGAVVAAANASPFERLDLKGTGFQDEDIPLLLSFPQLGYLNLSDTKVNGAALP